MPWILRMIEEQSHRDAEGRLLRESRAPAADVRPGEIQHRTCPYPGTRFQHRCPMNVSALHQTSRHWSDIVDALAFLRARHDERRPAGPRDVMDLWRVSQLGSALPWFHLLRDEAPAPAYAAAMAKATLGVGIWAQRMLIDRLTGGPGLGELTPAALAASSEASGTLVGDVEVCAASDAMLRRFFAAMIDVAPEMESDAMRALAADGDGAVRFGAWYAGWKVVLWLHALTRQFAYADLARALGAHAVAADVRAAIEAGGEPPDFVMIGPEDRAAVPRRQRAAGLAGLARLVVPFAPDGSDGVLAEAAQAIAATAGEDDVDAALVEEVAAAGLAAEAAETGARAIAGLVRLDAILADVATAVERGLRGAAGAIAPVAPIDAATRDRVLVYPPRAMLMRLAPRWVAGAARA